MIVDSHVHIYPPEVVRDQELISRTEPHFDLLTHNSVHKWGTAEELIARMDAEGVDQAWVFGFAFRDPALCALCNDYVIEAVRRWPQRLKGFAVVSPMKRGFVAEMERCRAAGLVGVGELFPQGQCFELDDARQTWRLAAACADLGMALCVHTAEPVGHDYAGKGDVGPQQAAAFCVNHPGTTVIFAHFGGGLWLYETMPEMRLYLQNAWYDTAAWPFLYDASMMGAAAAAGVMDKMLFGTDWPILGSARYEKRLAAPGLSDGEKEALMGGNARRLLDSMPPGLKSGPETVSGADR